LEILEAFLWGGIAPSLMEISLRVTNSPSQSSSLPYIMVITGFLPLFYGPCQGPERDDFVLWLNNLQIDDTANWMVLGDFNFYRSLSDKKKWRQ
jgi:hypothetical protein